MRSDAGVGQPLDEVTEQVDALALVFSFHSVVLPREPPRILGTGGLVRPYDLGPIFPRKAANGDNSAPDSA